MTKSDKHIIKHLELEKRRIKREILEYKTIINKLQAKGMDVTNRLNTIKKRLGVEL